MALQIAILAHSPKEVFNKLYMLLPERISQGQQVQLEIKGGLIGAGCGVVAAEVGNVLIRHTALDAAGVVVDVAGLAIGAVLGGYIQTKRVERHNAKYPQVNAGAAPEAGV